VFGYLSDDESARVPAAEMDRIAAAVAAALAPATAELP
jgi:hypothetical protein